ncbi:MAG: hypothetical protein ACHP9Z_13375 [Streptosporangiales bacterium]
MSGQPGTLPRSGGRRPAQRQLGEPGRHLAGGRIVEIEAIGDPSRVGEIAAAVLDSE